MDLTNKREMYHVENATDTLKLSGETTIQESGLISLSGQVSTVAAPFKSLSFSYNEDSVSSVNRSCNGISDIQDAANAFIDATVAAIKAKEVADEK